MTTLALYCIVAARIVEIQPILGIVLLASVGGATSAIEAVFLLWSQLRRCPSFEWLLDSDCCDRLLVILSPLRSHCGGPLRSSTSPSLFNFFLDGEKELGKEFTLGRRVVSQTVNRHRESVGLMAVEVQTRLHVKCQTQCVLTYCWFSLSHFPRTTELANPSMNVVRRSSLRTASSV